MAKKVGFLAPLRRAWIDTKHTMELVVIRALTGGVLFLLTCGFVYRLWGAGPVREQLVWYVASVAGVVALGVLLFAVNWVAAPTRILKDQLEQTEQERDRALSEALAGRRQLAALTEAVPSLVVDYEVVPESLIRAETTRRLLSLRPGDPDRQVVTIVSTGGFEGASGQSWLAYRVTVSNLSAERFAGSLLTFAVTFFRGGLLRPEFIVGEQEYPIPIPFLAPDKSYEFYVQNSGDTSVSVLLPTFGFVQLDGRDNWLPTRVVASEKSTIGGPNLLLPASR